MIIRCALIAASFSIPIAAQSVDIGCATDAGTATRVNNVHRANRRAAMAAPPVAHAVNGMFVVPKSPENSPFERPNNLEGKSVRFTPSGADSYTATALPLQYDSNVGTTSHNFVVTSQDGWQSFRFDLKNVKLPLFGQSVGTIYITAFNSIALASPSLDYSLQVDRTRASFTPEPTISPLLMTAQRTGWLNWPTAFVRELSDGVLVTWRAANNTFNYDVQARISANGEILFSYRILGTTTWGTAVITPGLAAFLPRLTTIAQTTGPVDGINPALDLVALALQHVEGTGGYLLIASLAGKPLASLPPRGDSEVFTFRIGNAPPMTVTLGWNGYLTASVPGGSQAGDISDNQVALVLFSDLIDPITNPTHITVETSMLSQDAPADRISMDVTMTDGPLPGVDLAAANATPVSLPVVDAFTVSTTDLESVWESVRAAGSFHDADIDGVFIFENFNNDIVLRQAAFASIGNSGDDNIWKFVRHGSAWPRSPNIMQMNVMGLGTRSDPSGEGSVLLHEFGHRWLQFVETMENGTPTITLNPSPAHPPQFSSTPAAFRVVNSYDTSTMGGGFFTQTGNIFTASPQSPYGYSWLDLYQMGLAAPEEVQQMYVIDGTSLGLAYNPPSNVVVSGTRHDLTIQQVIDAMGPRKPSSAASQRVFRTVFVLVADPTKPFDSDLAQLEVYRAKFAEMFSKATGNRASVITLFNPQPGRKRLER